MQRNFLWFTLDDLAFKLLLLGLALVLGLLLAIGFFLWLCQRKGRVRQRAKVHSAYEMQQKSKSLSKRFAGAPDHFGIGNKNKPPFFVLPRQNGSTIQQGNGQQHKLSNGFAAFFQDLPPRTPRSFERSPFVPLAPSPLNLVDYLDLDGGIKCVIRVDREGDWDRENNGHKNGANKWENNKFNENGAATINADKKPNGTMVAGRKDSIRPVNDIGLEEKMTLKNRPFKIIVNNDCHTLKKMDENGQGDFKMGPRGESPLMMRRFHATMEKVPENENERLFGEFESLNQQSMCTLRPRSSSAELPENIRKNRFYDILPFEFNRVKLRWANSAYGGTDGRSDFLNGSYIHTEDGLLAYIAAQGPIGPEEAFDGRRVNTVRDFWEMVWQEEVNCIVMLTQTKEGIKHKCAQYWPDSPGESEQFGADFSVHLYCVTEDDISFQRELWLHRAGQPERKILQWHFKEWRDATGPGDVENLVQFVEAIRASPRRRPILVHCSAGVGRSGVFIALDILLDKLAKEHVIDVKDTVSRLRLQRTNMVQNAEQYVALYEAIALAIRRKSRQN